MVLHIRSNEGRHVTEKRTEYRGPHTAVEGFYRIKIVRKGPWVGAEIRFEGDKAVAYVDGQLSLGTSGGWEQDAVDRIALWGEPITEPEHRFLLAQAEHARKHRPDHPAANPKKPIDFLLLKPVYTPRNRRV